MSDELEIKFGWWPTLRPLVEVPMFKHDDEWCTVATDNETAKLHMRDLSVSCPRCSAAAGVGCERLVLTDGTLRFVFPCGTTREEVEEVKRLTAERLREMQGGEQ